MSDMTLKIIIAILSVLVCVSEALSLIPSIEANGILQLIFQIILKVRDSLSKGN